MEKLKKERNEALKEMSKLKVILNFDLCYFNQESNFCVLCCFAFDTQVVIDKWKGRANCIMLRDRVLTVWRTWALFHGPQRLLNDSQGGKVEKPFHWSVFGEVTDLQSSLIWKCVILTTTVSEQMLIILKEANWKINESICKINAYFHRHYETLNIKSN